jgi:hypothetical protein
MANNTAEQRDTEPPDEQRGHGRRGTAVAILIRIAVPFGFAILVYKLAGHTKAELGTVQSLIQLAIAMVAGVAAYTIITEITLDRLPLQLTAKLNKVEKKLGPVESRLTQLSHKLQKLVDLHGMEMLFNQSEALEKARNLQNSAGDSVDAMWTFLPYDAVLQKYFAETLTDDGPFTRRVVAARSVPREHLIDHIDKAWDRLADHTYEIHLVHDCNYEVVIADRTKAALFIYSERGYKACYISSPAPEFANAVEGLVERLRRPDWLLPVEKGADKATDLAKIEAWVDNYYHSLP